MARAEYLNFTVAVSTDAAFRARCQTVHDILAAAGWVQTADTGQINLTSVAKPGAANTKAGYEIWRMADGLQLSAPAYLKVSYGTGGSAIRIGFWIQVGSATDGAGTLNGFRSSTETQCSGNGDTDANYVEWLCSAGSDYVCFFMSNSALSAPNLTWYVERTRDSAGTGTAEGLVQFVGSTLLSNISEQVVLYDFNLPDTLTNVTGVGSLAPPSTFTTSRYNNSGRSDAYIWPSYPRAGKTFGHVRSIIGAMNGDISPGLEVSITVHSATRTYRALTRGSITGWLTTPVTVVGTGLLIWE